MKKNEVKLSAKDIEAGKKQILDMCLHYGITVEAGGVGYETLYTDDMDETQGGWYCSFDKKMKERLREARVTSWQNIGMVSDDTINGLLVNLRDLGTKLRNRRKADPQTGLTKAETLTKMKVANTKAAINKFHSTGALTDEELNLCIKHYQTLEQAIHADQTLQLAWAYVSQSLNTLVQFKEARKRK
ncbi:hypothetical protein HOS33_gp286 [Erwinia phage vB_EamM_Y3]|uniref:Uncharacterized protein n=1 Tax=Erwinia phage vB_EamM_Y3 TaxID=1983553 RepID=A0A2H4IBJ3_9CAUD|nr:hypothetical protein HOS33_gp286 [Erwinia phage vB_EamM_Y3]ARW58926.1 hypothetical protein Y3_286 [Erwinia phage vB_EamM_Y3]